MCRNISLNRYLPSFIYVTKALLTVCASIFDILTVCTSPQATFFNSVHNTAPDIIDETRF